MMKEFLFHSMHWKGIAEEWLYYLIWIVAFLCVCYLSRVIYNKFRSQILRYKKKKYYMMRDLFLDMGGMEYLIIVVILLAIYLFFWTYYENFGALKWDSCDAYLIVLPQILSLIAVIVLFCVRYIKFRRPLIKK